MCSPGANQDLAGQVAAFLPAVHLVLEVDAGGAVLGEQLRELPSRR